MPTSLSCSFPFVPVESWPDGYLIGKELVILLECVVGKCFVVFCVFSFPPAVYVGTLNLIASIPGPLFLLYIVGLVTNPHKYTIANFLKAKKLIPKCTIFCCYKLLSAKFHG